jgi:hypothetical protein
MTKAQYNKQVITHKINFKKVLGDINKILKSLLIGGVMWG